MSVQIWDLIDFKHKHNIRFQMCTKSIVFIYIWTLFEYCKIKMLKIIRRKTIETLLWNLEAQLWKLLNPHENMKNIRKENIETVQ